MPRPFEAHGRRKIQDLNGFDMRDLCSGKSGSLPSFHLLGTVGHTIDGTLCAEDDKVLSKLHLCVILQGESKRPMTPPFKAAQSDFHDGEFCQMFVSQCNA
jgi:hypothetical protein